MSERPAASDASGSGPTVSVIVCAHTMDRFAELSRTLRSLQAQEPAAGEIIVVADNNAALMERVRADFPGLNVIANGGAKGLSGARNTGVRASSGDIVSFIDDDAEAGPGWVGGLRAHYADPDVIGVGGGVEPVWPGEAPAWFPSEFLWVIGCSYRGLPETASEVRNLIGCNMSFRRRVFEAVGGFREDLGRDGDNGFGCEETEFFIRASSAMKGRIVYDPALTVRHAIAPNRARWRYFIDRCRAEGRSKAFVVRAVGTGDGLSSERRYATRVLPAGVLRGVADGLRGDGGGLRRSGAIVAGFLAVASNYAKSRITERGGKTGRGFAPIRILDLDLDGRLDDLRRIDPATGKRYGGALCLGRRQGQPVALLEIGLDEGDVPADRLRDLLEAAAVEPAAPRQRTDLPPASVIVATRDRPESLARTLDSLLAQDYRPSEIIVVDSAPATNAAAELLAGRYASTGLMRYVHEPRPGLGRAHNRGLEAVRSPVVAFTDDDVVVDPHWLSAIAADFSEDPAVGCVTGLILPLELETRAQVWTERHGGFGKGLVRRAFDMGDNRPAGTLFPYAAGAFGSGANMAFSRKALQAIDGFDPALGAGTRARGGDDLAAFAAVLKAGFRLVYEPEAIIWHEHRRAEAGMRRQAFGYGVGLGAYLTKLVLDRPATALEFARGAPAAIAHLFGPTSDKNSRLPADYPRGLIWRERAGLLLGPAAYLASKVASRDRNGTDSGADFVPAGKDV